MKLSRNQKLVIGAATLWTTCYPFIFLLVWLVMPIYFLVAVWRAETPQWARPSAPLAPSANAPTNSAAVGAS